MKRKIISMVIGIIITNMICIFPVLAAGNNYNLYKSIEANENEIIPFADIIVKKYRVKNGKLQYRRWNETRECWVDPYWIDM